MSAIGAVHLVFSLLATAAGAWVLTIAKGTRWHRTLGHVYVVAMVGVVVTSFSMYNMTGRPGPFHLAALVSGGAVGGGLWSVLRRRPRKNWMEAHAMWMAWSYVGLLAAFASETLTRFVMPRVAHILEGNQLWGAFWAAVALATLAVIGVGSRLIKAKVPEAVRKTPEAMRRERRELEAADLASAGD